MPAPGDTGNEAANGRVSDAVEELATILKSLPSGLVDKLRDAHASDRSARIFSVVAQLAERNFDDAAIERILRAFPDGAGSKYVNRHDLGAEIARCRTRSAADC